MSGLPASEPDRMKESFADQIARLELMADGDPEWDLSDNDCAAIRALLENYRACVGQSVRRSES